MRLSDLDAQEESVSTPTRMRLSDLDQDQEKPKMRLSDLDRETTPTFYEKILKSEQETRAKIMALKAARQQEALAAEAEANKPENWSSTRFKKEAPKPRTLEEQAVYDATLAKKEQMEQDLKDRIAPDQAEPKEPESPEKEKNVKEINRFLEIQNEAAKNPYFRSLVSGLNQVNASITRIPALVYNVAAIPQNVAEKLTGWKVGTKAPDWMMDNPLAVYFDKGTESYNYRSKAYEGENIVSLTQKKEYGKAADYLIHSFIENVPNQLLLLAGSISGLSELQVLGSMGALQGSSTMKDATDRGVDTLSATADAVLSGGFEAIFERAGTFGLLKEAQKIFKDLGRATGKQILKATLKSVLHTTVGEANEEFWTQLAQDITDMAYGGLKLPWNQLLPRAVDAAAVGALSGAVMTSPTAAITGRDMAKKQDQINKIEAILQKVREMQAGNQPEPEEGFKPEAPAPIDIKGPEPEQAEKKPLRISDLDQTVTNQEWSEKGARQEIEAGGGTFLGITKGFKKKDGTTTPDLIQFRAPSGTTLALPADKFDRNAVKEKIRAAEEANKPKESTKKEPWEMDRDEFEKTYANGLVDYINKSKGMNQKEVSELTKQMIETGILKGQDMNVSAIPADPKMDQATAPFQSQINQIAQFAQLRAAAHFAHIRMIQEALATGKKVPDTILEFYRGWTDGAPDNPRVGWADEELFNRKHKGLGYILKRYNIQSGEKDLVGFDVLDAKGTLKYKSGLVAWKDADKAIKQLDKRIRASEEAAKKEGFDNFYHGTTSENVVISNRSESQNKYGNSLYVTKSEDLAKRYATDNGRVIRIQAKPGNVFQLAPKPGKEMSLYRTDVEISKWFKKLKDAGLSPDVVRSIDLNNNESIWNGLVDHFSKLDPKKANEMARQVIEKIGFDSIYHRRGSEEYYAIFKQENVQLEPFTKEHGKKAPTPQFDAKARIKQIDKQIKVIQANSKINPTKRSVNLANKQIKELIKERKYVLKTGKEYPAKKPRKAATYNIDKAVERGDRATLIKAHGGFSRDSKELKNFEPEERKKIALFFRDSGRGADDVLTELKGQYPDLFSEYEHGEDLLRAIANGDIYKKVDINTLEKEMEAHYERVAEQAAKEGLDEEAVRKAEEDVKRRAGDEGTPSESEGRTEEINPDKIYKAGDIVYDHRNGKVITYLGKDEKGDLRFKDTQGSKKNITYKADEPGKTFFLSKQPKEIVFEHGGRKYRIRTTSGFMSRVSPKGEALLKQGKFPYHLYEKRADDDLMEDIITGENALDYLEFENLAEAKAYLDKNKPQTPEDLSKQVQPEMPDKPLTPDKKQVDHGDLLGGFNEAEARRIAEENEKKQGKMFEEETPTGKTHRYKSKLRPYWMGIHSSFKSLGFPEYTLVEKTAKDFTIETKIPLTQEQMERMELDLVEEEAPEGGSYSGAGEGFYAESGKGEYKQAEVTPDMLKARLNKKMGGMEFVKPIESPELYKLVKFLTGSDITLNNLMKALGRFMHLDGMASFIELRKEVFKDYKLMQGVLAHEIGHLWDWLPHLHLKRGNILGRLGVLENFRRSFLPEYPGAPGELNDADKKRLKDEARRRAEQAKTGKVDKQDQPTNQFDPEVILSIWNAVTNNAPPELVEYIKKLDTEGKKAIIKSAIQAKKKGELVTVADIKKFNNDVKTDPKKVMDIYEQLIRDEIKKRKLWEEEEIRNEMKALTKWWHPFDEARATKKYLAYRYSSRELYAEFISALLNAPGKVLDMAPKSFQAFFNYIERKPEVYDSLLKTQALIQGGNDELFRTRERDIKAMFQRGRDTFIERHKRYEAAKRSLFYWVKNAFWDKNVAMLELRAKAAKAGAKINPNIDPKFILEERDFFPSIVRSYLELIDKTHEEILPIIDDVALYMFAKRIAIGDRQQYANSLAQNPKTAQDQLDFMKRTHPGKYANIEKLVNEIQDWFKTRIVPMMKDIYTPEQMQMVETSEAYAPFRVIDFMTDYVSSGIIAQEGTLRDITEPYTPLMKKAVSMILAAHRNQLKINMIQFMRDNPTLFDMTPARITQYPGVFHIEAPKERHLDTVSWREKGEWRAVHINKELASVINGASNDLIMVLNNAGRFISTILGNNVVFRPLWITFNLTFQVRNLARDMFRMWKSNKAMTFPQVLRHYAKAYPAAIRRVKNEYDATVNEMYRTGALTITYNDLILGRTDENAEIEQLYAQYDLAKPKEKIFRKIPVIRTLVKGLDGIRFMGDVIESLPKIAGYNLLKERSNLSDREITYIVRNLVGTPNFKRKGSLTMLSDSLLMFANIKKESVRGLLELGFTGKDKKHYWRKTFFLNMLPQILKFMAILGIFGSALKEKYEKISEYNNANYITIPVGVNDEGKTVYFRMVQDEDGRIWSALTWKILNMPRNGINEQDAIDVFNIGSDQFPTISPGLNLSSTWSAYMRGQMPYDDFRGRPILSDDQLKAGGMYSLEPMMLWSLNQAGIARFNVYDRLKNQTLAEKVTALTPVINSFVQISDYGKTERIRERVEPIKKQEAITRLERRSMVKEAVEKETPLIELLRGKSKQEQTTIKKAYTKQKARQVDDPFYKEINYATTNNQKIEILKAKAEEFSDIDDFRAYMIPLLRDKLISANVANQALGQVKKTRGA